MSATIEELTLRIKIMEQSHDDLKRSVEIITEEFRETLTEFRITMQDFKQITIVDGNGNKIPISMERKDFFQKIYDRLFHPLRGMPAKVLAIIGFFVAILQVIQLFLVIHNLTHPK